MAVVIETTLGDITVDLYLDQRPVTCLNFLKLCKMKYYNYNLFHTIRSDFIAQTGDPTGEGAGGESIWGILEGPQKRFFSGEKMPKIRHTGAGLLSMVGTNDMMVGSQFFFTLAPDLDSLDGTHCVIGEVTEGHEVLTKLNEVICDESNRPYRDVRITHTVVLEDPFNDPTGLRAPSRSPSPSAERLKGGRIAPDEEIDETQGKSIAEVQEMIEEKEAKARATILEIVGDLPDAEIAPPENVLFVCKLNPVTTDDDLEIIFSRFGKIVSCEVIRDKKTGNSLQYAFIEFENKKSCEDAYFKMDNVLIDDRRIHVDFSQSVSKMRWLGKGRGVQYLNDEVIKNPEIKRRDRDPKKDRDDDTIRKYHNDKKRQHDKESRNSRNDRDKEQKHDRERRNKKVHRSRSRSRSKHSSRERITKNGDRRDHKNIESDRYDKSHRHSGSYRERISPGKGDKNSNYSSKRHKESVSYKENRRSYEKKLDRKYKSHEDDTRTKDSRRKDKSLDSHEKSKKSKNNHNLEPKTPSPVAKNNKDKNTKRKDRNKSSDAKKRSKRKHKKSTSSESDSSESSSTSSDSSSSSESDNKKNKAKRKKRKYSSSSSSDSSSSSSSSSSDSSSDSSSSTSDSEPSKKKAKKVNNKSKNSRNK